MGCLFKALNSFHIDKIYLLPIAKFSFRPQSTEKMCVKSLFQGPTPVQARFKPGTFCFHAECLTTRLCCHTILNFMGNIFVHSVMKLDQDNLDLFNKKYKSYKK